MITNDPSDREMARKTLMVMCGVINGLALVDKKQCFEFEKSENSY